MAASCAVPGVSKVAASAGAAGSVTSTHSKPSLADRHRHAAFAYRHPLRAPARPGRRVRSGQARIRRIRHVDNLDDAAPGQDDIGAPVVAGV